jgi:hypothetical protein
MDDKDKPGSPDDDASTEEGVPLLDDVVFDASLPLRAPTSRPPSEAGHGPDYDPDTIDLFEDTEMAKAEEELRIGAEKVIEDLVQEFSAEITGRLRSELTDQLKAILNDLDAAANPDTKKSDR